MEGKPIHGDARVNRNQQGTGTSACVASGRGNPGVKTPGSQLSRGMAGNPDSRVTVLPPLGSVSTLSREDLPRPGLTLPGGMLAATEKPRWLGIRPPWGVAERLPRRHPRGRCLYSTKYELQRKTRMKRRAALHTARKCRPPTFPHTNVSARIVLEPKWLRIYTIHYIYYGFQPGLDSNP